MTQQRFNRTPNPNAEKGALRLVSRSPRRDGRTVSAMTIAAVVMLGMALGAASPALADAPPTQTIPVQSFPFRVAVTPNGSQTYVTNLNSGSVSDIDVASNTVKATILVGSRPIGIAISPDGTTAYVTNNGDSTVSVIDVASNIVTSTIGGFGSPNGIAITPNGLFAYVANDNDGSVIILDLATNTVESVRIAVGNYPYDVSISPNGAVAYVANFGANSVSVIDLLSNQVTATISVGRGPDELAFTPDSKFAYVADWADNNFTKISVIDNATTSIPVGGTQGGVAVSPDGANVYVTNAWGHSIWVISVASDAITSTIPGGDEPYSVAFTPNGAAYVANISDNTVTSIAPMNRAPEITLDLKPLTVLKAGQSVTLTVAADASPIATVAWSRSVDNGLTWQAIEGQTSTTYTFVPTKSWVHYKAIFTNTHGVTETHVTSVHFGTIPVIVTQIAPTATVAYGHSTPLTATAKGLTSPTVTWLSSTTNGDQWNIIPGATSTTYFAAPITTGTLYKAVFTNNIGSVATNVSTVTVISTLKILTSPTSVTVKSGSPVTLFAFATAGELTVSAVWQSSTNNGAWVTIAGVTSPYMFIPVSTGIRYRVVFSAGSQMLTSNISTVTVNALHKKNIQGRPRQPIK